MAYGPTQLVVSFSPVQDPLHHLPEQQDVHIFQEIDGPEDAVQLPHGAFRSVLPHVGTQLSNDHALRGDLEPQGHQDFLDVGPLGDDELRAHSLGRPQQEVLVFLEILKAVETFRLSADIPVPGSELVAESVENQEIDAVGPVGIDGVPTGLYFGRVVVQDVEDEVAFVGIGPDDLGIDGHIVRHQGV